MKPSYTSKEAINRAQQTAARFFNGSYGEFIDRVHPNLQTKIQKERAARQAEVSQRRAEANRLVKAAKSPTDRFPGLTGAFFNRKPAGPALPPVQIEKTPPAHAQDLRQPGTYAVIERRAWAGEWRVRTEARPGCLLDTPDQAGARFTRMLSTRGGRKIADACYYTAVKRGGMTTFCTLTLGQGARDLIERREWRAAGDLSEPFEDGSGRWMVSDPVRIDPVRAKQGRLAPDFSGEYQTSAGATRLPVAGPFGLLDPETRRPFTPVQRAYVWSVQREAGRFFEAANKMYQRGWQYRRAVPASTPIIHPESGSEYSPLAGQWKTVKVPGNRALYCVEGPGLDKGTGAEFTRIKWWREPLDYLWVAEAPDKTDDDGRPVADADGVLITNPHLHVLMRWRVDYRHFRYWARRLERLWGQGMAHLEKIKDGSKAGSYVAKAAGYLCKAQGKDQNDQGEIRGNRYAISKRARAPGWTECERHQIGIMGWLLAEYHEAWQAKHGDKIRQREKLKLDLDATSDPGHRQKIGKILEAVRAQIEPLPRASKYAVILKNEYQAQRWLAWAERRGWSRQRQESLWLVEWRRAQLQRRYGNQAGGPNGRDWEAWFAQADSGAVHCDEVRDDSSRAEMLMAGCCPSDRALVGTLR